ncbi:MAG TPA: hypothetical protein VFJ29_05155, partial [Candidatus Kapabacteria bacterium]|nr:hypothetical protein [Candidatus Kapabacteria bacterium]
NNPTGSNNNNNNGTTFAFVVGDTFYFDQWQLDANGNKIAATHEKLRQIIASTGLQYQGKSGVTMAIDSVTDTTGQGISADTTYYSTEGSSISVYGLVAKLVAQYSNNQVVITPVWNKMIDVGNTSGWLTDSTATTYSGYPATEVIHGKDTGNVNITVGANTLTTDYAIHHGSVTVSIASAPITLHVYASTNPSVLVKSVADPTKVLGTPYNGIDLELSSYSVVK